VDWGGAPGGGGGHHELGGEEWTGVVHQEGVAVIMSWAGKSGLGWCTRRGWRSS
jgi:hypothetical protein